MARKKYLLIVIFFIAMFNSMAALKDLFILHKKPHVDFKTFYLMFSPSAILFDTQDGFYSELKFKIFYNDDSTQMVTEKLFISSAVNYLEIIMFRRLEFFFMNEKIFKEIANNLLCLKRGSVFSGINEKVQVQEIFFTFENFDSKIERKHVCN